MSDTLNTPDSKVSLIFALSSVTLACVAMVGGMWWYQGYLEKQQTAMAEAAALILSQQTPVPTPTPVAIPNDWLTLTHAQYTFKYPKEATAEPRAEESVVHFRGPKQVASGRTQTELFDGYSFRVGLITPEPNQTLEQTAQTERNNAESNCVSGGEVSGLKPVMVAGQAGFQYSVKGCYLDNTETIITHEGTTYRLTQAYVGEAADQAAYQALTEQMVASFEFTK